jgi:rhodanese-related sulfurtransferase
MMKFVRSALTDADIILYVADIKEPIEANEIMEKVVHATVPVILALNKIDTVDQPTVKERMAQWQALLPKAQVILLSALETLGTDSLLETLVSLLPEGEPFYDKEALTDKPERFFVSEIIREKIFMNYQQEIPYSCEVEIEEYKEEETITRLSRIGFDHVLGYLEGGFESWTGKEIDSVHRITSSEFEARFHAGECLVIDVRKESEYSALHVETAINKPLNEINDWSGKDISGNGPVFIHCAGGK